MPKKTETPTETFEASAEPVAAVEVVEAPKPEQTPEEMLAEASVEYKAKANELLAKHESGAISFDEYSRGIGRARSKAKRIKAKAEALIAARAEGEKAEAAGGNQS